MSNPMNKGNLFDPELVSDLFNKVRGKSSLAVLCAAQPIPFTGTKQFTFSFDSDVDIVGESGAKSHGGISMEPVVISPLKFEYGARISDEFLNATEEQQIDMLQSFNDGFAAKLAAGIDKAAFHGINPRSGAASTVVGTNHFDSKVTTTVTYAAATADAKLDDAIGKVEDSDFDVTGIAMSPAMRSALAAMRTSGGDRMYPEFAFGGQPATLGSQKLSINKTVSTHASGAATDHAIVGDFAGAFRWGYAKEIRLELIEYGDPDNSGKDLKGYNQVYLRAEAYVGWGIMDGAAFARVTASA